jgi:N-acyl-D-amino-acid deacylase
MVYFLLAIVIAFAGTMAVPAAPMTGDAVPELIAFDQQIAEIMEKWKIPGGQIAIARDGKLVMSRGYGYADAESKRLVYPDSLFRIGSVSKTLTTVAVLKLVENGKLRLHDKVFDILSDLKPPRSAPVDSRLGEITVQNLLQHSGGCDGEKSYHPLELPWSRTAAATFGVKDPPDCTTVIRYMLGVPLDFDPGTKVAYSNFGYCILGRVIERTIARNGRPSSYDHYVRSAVLAPAGVKDMRLAGTRASERATKEVRYYGEPGRPNVPSVYPGEGFVPFAYGGLYILATDASGGWIGSAEDLVRFATAIDGQRAPALLSPESIRTMLSTPIPAGDNPTAPVGLCWTVARRENGVDFWHIGGIADSNANWLVRTHSGAALAVNFNSLPKDHSGFYRQVIPTLLERLESVKRWPIAKKALGATSPSGRGFRRSTVAVAEEQKTSGR